MWPENSNFAKRRNTNEEKKSVKLPSRTLKSDSINCAASNVILLDQNETFDDKENEFCRCHRDLSTTTAYFDEKNNLGYFENIKQCPQCSTLIERAEGCAQIMCKVCRHTFCFYCLASLDVRNLKVFYFL